MISSFRKFCKYIYETLSERFEDIYSINKSSLENENMNYCRMQDGELPINIKKTEKGEKEESINMNKINSPENNSEKIKSRMESYKK